MNKKYLSPTQLGMYLRCGEQYRRRYIEGEKIPPGIAMIKGGSVHKGSEANFRQKIESQKDLPANEIKEVAAANFEGQISQGYILSPDENAVGVRKVLAEAKDSTIRLVDVYASDIAPFVMPEFVENRQYIELPGNNYDLLSIIDVATTDKKIIDLKTTSRKKRQAEADDSDQLSWQAMAYRKLTGEFPKGLKLEVMIDTGRNTGHQTLSTIRAEQDVQILLNKINAMIAGVKAGIFLPAEPGSWVCSHRFCGYWNTCHYVNRERREAAEKGE